MYNLFSMYNLQLFADGGGSGAGSGTAGDGGDGGASAQAESGLANQETTLESLGVPRDKAEKYRQRKHKNATVPAQAEPHVETVQKTAEQIVPAEAEVKEQVEAPKSLKDLLKANPQFNQEAQEMITGRVKNLNARLAEFEPIIELLGNHYGFDTSDLSKIDLKELASKVTDDNQYYEDAAAEMGTDLETAKRITKLERETKRAEREQERINSENALREHYGNLQRQAEALKATIPGFDLDSELQNPQFLRMTSPEGGLTVEQAFHALHFREINQYNQQQTAQNVAKALSNSIQSGRSMPTENGTVQRAASTVQAKPYSQMTATERAEFQRQLRAGKRF